MYISPISKNLPRRTDGLRSRDYQMCDYWRRNEELRPSTIVKDVLFNDSRWLHDQAPTSTHLSHKTLGLYISRAWLLWKRVRAYLTLACVARVSVRFRRLISKLIPMHTKISRMHRKPNFRTHRAPLRLLDARVLLIQAARGEHANGRGSLLLFSPRASSRFLPSRPKNGHLKQARTCLVPNMYCVFPCEERILA